MKRTILTLVAAGGLVISMAGSASALTARGNTYSDLDSWWIRMTSRVVAPVGIVVENFVTRPFTAATRWSDRDPARYKEVTGGRECGGLRPYRYCSTNAR